MVMLPSLAPPPQSDIFAPGLVAPQWRPFVEHLAFLVAAWNCSADGTVGDTPRDLVTGTPNASTSIQLSNGQLGPAIEANTSVRHFFDMGLLFPMKRLDRFTIVAVMEFDDLATDQATIFAKSTNGVDPSDRRFIFTTTTSGALEVRDGANTYITSTATLSTGRPYLVVAVNDASALSVHAFEINGRHVIDGETGTWSSEAGNDDQALQFLAHFSATNDDLNGRVYWVAGLNDYVMPLQEIEELARNPFGPFYPWWYSYPPIAVAAAPADGPEVIHFRSLTAISVP